MSLNMVKDSFQYRWKKEYKKKYFNINVVTSKIKKKLQIKSDKLKVSGDRKKIFFFDGGQRIKSNVL